MTLPTTLPARTARRVVAITAGLAATGAVVGTACAAAALVLTLGPRETWDWDLLGAAAIVGGGMGAVAAPAVAWALLRHVPLGRAVAWCAVGSVLGGVAGMVAPGALGDPIATAVAGFLGAAILVRLCTPR